MVPLNEVRNLIRREWVKGANTTTAFKVTLENLLGANANDGRLLVAHVYTEMVNEEYPANAKHITTQLRASLGKEKWDRLGGLIAGHKSMYGYRPITPLEAYERIMKRILQSIGWLTDFIDSEDTSP